MEDAAGSRIWLKQLHHCLPPGKPHIGRKIVLDINGAVVIFPPIILFEISDKAVTIGVCSVEDIGSHIASIPLCCYLGFSYVLFSAVHENISTAMLRTRHQANIDLVNFLFITSSAGEVKYP